MSDKIRTRCAVEHVTNGTAFEAEAVYAETAGEWTYHSEVFRRGGYR